MRTVHELSRVEACRVAVRAQMLDRPQPTDLLDTVRRLTVVQHDPTNAVAPSADLVLWSRLGSAYRAQDLRDALDAQKLIELRGMLRPAEDLVLYRAQMAEWPGSPPVRPWRKAHAEWAAVDREIAGLAEWLGCDLDDSAVRT